MADLALNPPGPFDKKPWDKYLAPLDEDLWRRFRWFCDLCRDEFGIEQYALSAYRPADEQIYLRKQNCGTSQYDIYKKPAMQCRPPTAIPGTSQHERGKAIDCGFGYNDVPNPARMKQLAAQCGFDYTVEREDWHLEVVRRTPIPAKYNVYIPPSEEDEMQAPFIGRNPQGGEIAIFYPGTPFRVFLKTNEDVAQAQGKPPFGMGLIAVGDIDPWFFRNTQRVPTGT